MEGETPWGESHPPLFRKDLQMRKRRKRKRGPWGVSLSRERSGKPPLPGNRYPRGYRHPRTREKARRVRQLKRGILKP